MKVCSGVLLKYILLLECPVDDDPQSLGYSRLAPASPSPQLRTPSSESTPRGFSSLDTDRDVETPVLDEFAQFVNASIHPPNELSIPRCYPSPPHSPSALLTSPLTAPNSRRPSASSRLAAPNHRNARSLSLGLSPHCGPPRSRPTSARSFSK